ncbi:MAG TPA: acetamidase/formamidase family protein [Ktedonobacteraceae bacterium]|nr:acetamidase/formamidase family protein [Ktedonobacteraceae bacterium]
MATYTIEPEQGTLHGSFSREFPPIVTIHSGDTVVFRTLEVSWGLEPRTAPGVPYKQFAPRAAGRDDGHALCGPVAIEGSKPGMTLEVRINEIRPGAWGWTIAGGRMNETMQKLGITDPALLAWTLNADTMTGRDQHGRTIPLRPFMGIMGLPPDEPGIHSTVPPRFCGGNMDCKELVAGSTLFLPITVPGALFSTGDGHAVQGDGEVSGVGLECPMERVSLTFFLRDDLHLNVPRAQTPAGWVTIGSHTDMHEASLIALGAMLDLLEEHYHLPRSEALAFASLAVDLHVSQIVNGGVYGVHAILPYAAIAGVL